MSQDLLSHRSPRARLLKEATDEPPKLLAQKAGVADVRLVNAVSPDCPAVLADRAAVQLARRPTAPDLFSNMSLAGLACRVNPGD